MAQLLPGAEMLGLFLLAACKLKHRNPPASRALGGQHLCCWKLDTGFSFMLDSLPDPREMGANDRVVRTFLTSSDRR